MGGPGSGLAHDHGVDLVVVALPTEDDPVRQYSSEKEAHFTLLYLGKTNIAPADLAHITEYIGHAASQITAFWVDVERRGELGDNKADVLFFSKRWLKTLENFRNNLLQDETIARLYHSTFQFPEWTPHLTMGFPETPAKPDKREFNRFHSVRFDKIALWTNDSEGPTFQLKTEDDMEVAMSQQQGANIAAAVLAKHNEDLVQYGKKGMKWGVRKSDPLNPRSPKQTEPNSGDAQRVIELKTRVKTQKTTRPLTNTELRAAIDRMRLEQDFSKLSGGIDKTRRQKATGFIAQTLLGIGKQQVSTAANNAAAKQVASVLNKKK
jgi:2'-5' RNA ligase